ncbi:prolyl oligopeptidase family serine peptidase [Mycoplasma marinum]|uniref:S9 family peptidase n=1 Tax=Mycoplasma marinum TaxID=1937190 RepID=A0A4R0XSE8_9MOLU|nr:prolyl oligopeptidase family serine peptidase [Mycoplasma marinum]TCG11350.1 S9 family peptidase [Mycoplasma marinum]
MQIPLKEFFKNSSKGSFSLSPDRTKIAFLDSYKERRNIYILDVETEEVEIITTQQRRNIYSYSWKNNDKILYTQDNNGDENDHVFLVDIKTKEEKDITPGEKLKVAGLDTLNIDVYIDKREQYKNKILVSHNERNGASFDLYMYDIVTGKRELVEEHELGEDSLLFDMDLFKSIYTSKTIQGGDKIFKDGKEIKFVSSKDSFSILGFTSKAKDKVYVMSNENRDKTAIFTADLNLNIIGDPIFENDIVDAGALRVDYFTKKPICVWYEEEKYDVKYLDKEVEAKHNKWRKMLIERFPAEKDSIIIVGALLGTNDKIVSFSTMSDKKLRDEYFYFADQDKLIKMSEDQKYLIPENLVDMKPISYKARDGLTIHGYLTLPKDVKGPIPIIVNPHGGPWVRDSWGYSPEAQFFANRGFGWFQPNFRISTGYGKDHFVKGWHQWGLNCQHDVTDGTHWLVEQGYTKPGMIGIYGGSYGGYATLMGIINEPKLYSAAVDYVGVSDLFTFWDGFPDYWKVPGNIFEEAMGNPYDNPEHSKRISPVYRSSEIETPLMVVQGAKDPRVPIKQAEQIVESMKKNGVQVEYILKENEGHGFSNQENRFDLYEKMLNFFNKHLNK